MWNHCLTRATHQSFVGLFSHCALSACSISFSPSFTDLLLPFIIFSADIFKANKTYNSNDLQLGACFPMEPCALFANAQVHDVVGNSKGSYVVSKTRLWQLIFPAQTSLCKACLFSMWSAGMHIKYLERKSLRFVG